TQHADRGGVGRCPPRRGPGSHTRRRRAAHPGHDQGRARGSLRRERVGLGDRGRRLSRSRGARACGGARARFVRPGGGRRCRGPRGPGGGAVTWLGERLRRCREDESGTALIEFTWLGLLLLVPLVYIMLSVFDAQRGAFAA